MIELRRVYRSTTVSYTHLASANSGFDHLFLGHLSRFLGHIGLLLLNNQFGGLRCLIGRLHGILHGYLHVRLLTA